MPTTPRWPTVSRHGSFPTRQWQSGPTTSPNPGTIRSGLNQHYITSSWTLRLVSSTSDITHEGRRLVRALSDPTMAIGSIDKPESPDTRLRLVQTLHHFFVHSALFFPRFISRTRKCVAVPKNEGPTTASRWRIGSAAWTDVRRRRPQVLRSGVQSIRFL